MPCPEGRPAQRWHRECPPPVTRPRPRSGTAATQSQNASNPWKTDPCSLPEFPFSLQPRPLLPDAPGGTALVAAVASPQGLSPPLTPGRARAAPGTRNFPALAPSQRRALFGSGAESAQCCRRGKVRLSAGSSRRNVCVSPRSHQRRAGPAGTRPLPGPLGSCPKGVTLGP